MNLSDEMALALKLLSLGEKDHLFDGLTTFEQRKEKARVLVKRWPDVVFTIKDGKNYTMRQQFEKAYRCEL